MYSFEMSPSIRQKVDEFMNCEDIAMAFFISHIIRKPLVLVRRGKRRKTREQGKVAGHSSMSCIVFWNSEKNHQFLN